MFQSTPPVWRATKRAIPKAEVKSVSIHAPRVEGDLKCRWW